MSQAGDVFDPDYKVREKLSDAGLRAAATLAVQNLGYESLKEMRIKVITELMRGQLTVIDFPRSIDSFHRKRYV